MRGAGGGRSDRTGKPSMSRLIVHRIRRATSGNGSYATITVFPKRRRRAVRPPTIEGARIPRRGKTAAPTGSDGPPTRAVHGRPSVGTAGAKVGSDEGPAGPHPASGFAKLPKHNQKEATAGAGTPRTHHRYGSRRRGPPRQRRTGTTPPRGRPPAPTAPPPAASSEKPAPEPHRRRASRTHAPRLSVVRATHALPAQAHHRPAGAAAAHHHVRRPSAVNLPTPAGQRSRGGPPARKASTPLPGPSQRFTLRSRTGGRPETPGTGPTARFRRRRSAQPSVVPGARWNVGYRAAARVLGAAGPETAWTAAPPASGRRASDNHQGDQPCSDFRVPGPPPPTFRQNAIFHVPAGGRGEGAASRLLPGLVPSHWLGNWRVVVYEASEVRGSKLRGAPGGRQFGGH